jgi:hypothetical protein
MPITKHTAFSTIALAVITLSVASGSAVFPHKVSRADLCVTEGTIEGGPASSLFTVDSPKMRAYVNATPVQSIAARFTYLGATSHDVPSDSSGAE